MHKRLLLFIILSILYTSCTNETPWEEKRAIQTKTEASDNFREFPTISQIVGNSTVRANMEKSWNEMKITASKDGRSEYGFYIYYSPALDIFWVGEIVQGYVTGGCESTNASIALGPVVNNLEACAFFHCHTTLEFCPEGTSRKTGPSPSDKSFAKSTGLPGILYDYSAEEIGGGHSKSDPYKMYTFGPSRRPGIFLE